jgi:hypothetical protein
MKKLILAGLVLITAGCINYTSVMQIAEDGSGILMVEVEFPYRENVEISLDEFDEDYQFPDGWETTDMRVDTLDTTIVYRLQGKFDDPHSAADVIGIDTLSFKKETEAGPTRLYFTRNYESLEGFESHIYFESTLKMLGNLTDYDLDEYTWTEKLVLEGNIIEHNADERKGDTLIWKRKTNDVIKEGLTIEVSWEPAK